MRVVVTGAAGFIGSALCEALVKAGWRVLGIDAFTESYEPELKRENLAELIEHADFTFVESDLGLTDLRALLDSADAVVHLAAETREKAAWGNGFARFVERNVLATERVLEAASACGTPRFIYASSSAVYGEAACPVLETATPQPISPYGVSKLAGEHLASLHASRGLPVVILRYFSVYGPRQRPDMAVRRFIESALDNQPFSVLGDGRQVRDLTYVGDVVTATTAALTAPLAPGTVLNIAGGHRVSMLDLAAKIGELTGVESPRVLNQPARAGEVQRSEASISAALTLLGWQPVSDLDTGLARQIEWQAERRRQRRRRPLEAARPGGGTHRDGPRLMIYTQDGLGLGHLRRASSLAAEFLRREPDGWVLTTSDSPLGTLLRDIPNHDYLKLPSIVKAGPGDWHPLSSPLEVGRLLQLRSRLILEAATAFQPDVLLVDHMPHGAMGELIPTLETLRERGTRIVLGLRDIIDAPDVVQQRWESEGALDALANFFDLVLVYGSQDVFDVCREYGWPDDLARLVRYCGYVCTAEKPADAARLRSRRLAALPAGALIVAMAGGGADAHGLMSTLLDALPAIHARRPCALEIVTGPFMPDDQRQDLKRRAQVLPVRMRSMVRDPLARVAAADLVVAMAGYNTTMEILRLGTPALLVPRRGPSREQRMRARRFADRGWVHELGPDGLTPERLAGAVLEALSSRSKASPGGAPDLEGLTRAVDHLLAGTAAHRPAPARPASVPLRGIPPARRLASGS